MCLFVLLLTISFLLLLSGRAYAGRIALALSVALFPFAAFGADPAGAVNNWTAHFTSWSGIAAAGAAVVLELVFRLVPTQTPLSWAWIVSNTLHALSKLTEAVAEFLDKVLPQRRA